MVLRACDLSPEQRQAAELLLGEPLGGDGAVYIRMSRGRLIKPPLEGPEREQVLRDLIARADETAARVAHLPESEIDAAIDEAIDFVRHHRR